MHAIDRVKNIAAGEALIGLHQIEFFCSQQFTRRAREAAITIRRREVARIHDLVRDGGIRTLRPCSRDDGRLRTMQNQGIGRAVQESLGSAEGIVSGADEGEFHAGGAAVTGAGGMGGKIAELLGSAR